jgi:hypothetical protein
MLVGGGAASAAANFAKASPYRILPVGPTSVNHQTELVTGTDDARFWPHLQHW